MIELQYHSKLNIVFLFKCYWYDTTDREIKVDPHYGLIKINTKARLHNINNVFLFLPSNAHNFITYTLLHLKRIIQWLISYL